MVDGDPAFFDLEPGDLPLTIEFLNAERTVVHTITVNEPGVVEVPPLRKDYGPINVRITYPGGVLEA